MPFDQLEPAPFFPPPEVLARLSSPALLVHLDVARRNVERVVELCGGDPSRWRPHVKTTKLPEVWAELVRSGVRHFKCATTKEAAVLCELLDAEGVQGDVLLAQPLRGPGLARLGALAAAHARQEISVLCEDPGGAGDVPGPVSIFVDVNVGMDRTGVPIAALEGILAVARAAGPRLRGLHAYEGHLCQEDAGERSARAREVYGRCVELVRALAARGIPTGELVTSGTPTLRDALDHAPLRALPGTRHRVSPGTVVFHDARSEELDPGLGLAPAALVLARVVSHPAPDSITCDAGSKSIAAEAGSPCAVVLGRPGLAAGAPSEEHLPLRLAFGAAPERGTALLLAPRHVCPTVNLADEAVLLEGGRFLGVAAVRARGHETLIEG